MPINVDALQADPEFLMQFPNATERQRVLERLRKEQTTQAPQRAPQAPPPLAGVNVQALQADPEFQALSAQEQAQLMQRVQPVAPGGLPAPPPADQPLTEGITAPSTMIPLLTGGAGIKAAQQTLAGAAPWVGRLVRPVAEGLSQTLGFGTGRTVETGKPPSPGELGRELGFTTAAGHLIGEAGQAGNWLLRHSRAAKALQTSDDVTKAAYAKWQADEQAVQDAARSQQKELYDTAVIKAKVSQREYEMATRARTQGITEKQQSYETELRGEQESRYNLRRQEIAEQQADYQAKELARTQDIAARQQTYEGAIRQQGEAITQARAIPGRYAPEMPSRVQYERYEEAAKDVTFDLTPATARVADMRASRGLLPDGSMRPFPEAVEKIATNLEQATGAASFKTIHQELKRLGPLTRDKDGAIRGPAKQLFGIYADILESSPLANDALRTANATFRKEMAMAEVNDWLKLGGQVITRDSQGRQRINVEALFKKADRTVGEDSLFRGSFASPDELAAFQADISKLAGTPPMPRQAPGTPPRIPVPQPEALPGAASNVPARLQQPPREPAAIPLPGDIPVKQVPVPAPTEAPSPVTPAQALGDRPAWGARTTTLGQMVIVAHELGIPRWATSPLVAAKAVQLGAEQSRWLMAHALLDPSKRKLMQAAIDGQGIVNPRLYGFLLASLSPAERKAYQRDTGSKGEQTPASRQAPGGIARSTD